MTYQINKKPVSRKQVQQLCKYGELELLERFATNIFANGGSILTAKMTEEIDVSITQ